MYHGPRQNSKEENYMDPIKMSATLDDSIVHLDQIAATLEMVLSHIFEHENVDLNGSEAEITAALTVCEQYPAWRAVLSHVWESLVNERDELAALAMRATGRHVFTEAVC